MFGAMFKNLTILMLTGLLLWITSASAQPILPQIGGFAKDGITVLNWTNPFGAGVKSIAIQRSTNSQNNFTTIGILPGSERGAQQFVDPNPLLGDNWYMAVIIFNDDKEWESNKLVFVMDSMSIANRKPLPPADSLQQLIAEMNADQRLNTLQDPADAYKKSRFVFTNPYTGNINIEIEDAVEGKYSLVFFSSNGVKELEIPRVRENMVILDKRNFNRSGNYSFKLFKDKQLFESGFITIY